MNAVSLLQEAFELAHVADANTHVELELRIQNEEFSLSEQAWSAVKQRHLDVADAPFWVNPSRLTPMKDTVFLHPNDAREIRTGSTTIWQHKQRVQTWNDATTLCPYRARLSLATETQMDHPPQTVAQKTRQRERLSYWPNRLPQIRPPYEFHLTKVTETDSRRRTVVTYELEVEFNLHVIPTVVMLLDMYDEVMSQLRVLLPNVSHTKEKVDHNRPISAFRAYELTQSLLASAEVRVKRPVNFPNIRIHPYDLLTVDIDQYSVTNKLNGEYVRLLRLPNGEWFACSETKQEQITQTEEVKVAGEGCCVLEAEEWKNKFYVFDVVLWNGTSVMNLPHDERLQRAKNELTHPLPSRVLLKKFETAVQAGPILSTLNADDNDGLIFTPIGPGLDIAQPIFKWKYADQMSIDFRLLYTSAHDVRLMVGDSDQCEKEWTGTKMFPMNQKMLPATTLPTGESVASDTIVEVVWNATIERLQIHRTRPDKRVPNFRTTAESVWNDLFVPITDNLLRRVTDPDPARRWKPSPHQPSFFLGKYGNEFVAKTRDTLRVKTTLRFARVELFEQTCRWVIDWVKKLYPSAMTTVNAQLLNGQIWSYRGVGESRKQVISSRDQNLQFSSTVAGPDKYVTLQHVAYLPHNAIVSGGYYTDYREFHFNDVVIRIQCPDLRSSQSVFDLEFTWEVPTRSSLQQLDLCIRAREFLAEFCKNTFPNPRNTSKNDIDYMSKQWNELSRPEVMQFTALTHRLREKMIGLKKKPFDLQNVRNNIGWLFQNANGTYLMNAEHVLLQKCDEIPSHRNRQIVIATILVYVHDRPSWIPFHAFQGLDESGLDEWCHLHRFFSLSWVQNQVNTSSVDVEMVLAVDNDPTPRVYLSIGRAGHLEEIRQQWQEPLTMMRLAHNQIKSNLIREQAARQTVLDLGIGRGGDLGKYRSAGIAHLWGVDPSTINLDQCRDRLAKTFPAMKHIVELQEYPAEDPRIPHWVRQSAFTVDADCELPVNQPELSIFFPSTVAHRALSAALMINEEGEYSITRRTDGDAMMTTLLEHIGPALSGWTVVDGTANMGGDTLNFAKYAQHVVAVEYNQANMQCLLNNVKAYGYKNVECIHDDVQDVWPARLSQTTDLLYLDPPWGGSGYKQLAVLDLFLGDKRIELFLKDVVEMAAAKESRLKYIVIKVPKNARLLREAARLSETVDVLELNICDRFVALVLCLLPMEKRYRGWKRIGVASSFFSLSFFFEPSSAASSKYPAVDALLQNVCNVVAEGGRFMGTTIDGDRLRTLLHEQDNKTFSFSHGGYYRQLDEHTVELNQPGTIVDRQTEWFVDFEYVRNQLILNGWSIDLDRMFDRIRSVNAANMCAEEQTLNRLYRVFSFRAPFTFVLHLDQEADGNIIIRVPDPTVGEDVTWRGTRRCPIQHVSWKRTASQERLSGVYEVMYTDWSDASRPRFYLGSERKVDQVAMTRAHLDLKWDMIHM